MNILLKLQSKNHSNCVYQWTEEAKMTERWNVCMLPKLVQLPFDLYYIICRSFSRNTKYYQWNYLHLSVISVTRYSVLLLHPWYIYGRNVLVEWGFANLAHSRHDISFFIKQFTDRFAISVSLLYFLTFSICKITLQTLHPPFTRHWALSSI